MNELFVYLHLNYKSDYIKYTVYESKRGTYYSFGK